MLSRGLLICRVTLALPWMIVCPAFLAAQTATIPASSTPPQQMSAYEVPAAYPSAAASAYPSTPAAGSPALPPYDRISPVVTAVAQAGAIPASPPTMAGGTMNGQTDSVPLYTPYGSPDAMAASRALDRRDFVERSLLSDEPWSWQILPNGLMYRSYLAGNKEPRLASQWVNIRSLGWRWDLTAGGRVGLLRYGTDNESWPQGWQLDAEGAAFPRLDLEHLRDLDTVDFRAGFPLTSRQGPWEFKFGYYHLSSHLGDEFVIRNPDFPRINYVRESLVSGLAVYLNPSMRLYTEAGWAFYIDGGAKPWEFQFGIDVSSPDPTGGLGSPFFAINAHLRQENDFGGNMNVQTGWQWRGRSGHLFRIGVQYFNGMSDQYQFFDKFEEQIGMGIWYDY